MAFQLVSDLGLSFNRRIFNNDDKFSLAYFGSPPFAAVIRLRPELKLTKSDEK